MAETTADKIARLEAILAAGATSTKAGDLAATFDLAEVRRQLRELRDLQDGTARRRPVVSQIKLN